MDELFTSESIQQMRADIMSSGDETYIDARTFLVALDAIEGLQSELHEARQDADQLARVLSKYRVVISGYGRASESHLPEVDAAYSAHVALVKKRNENRTSLPTQTSDAQHVSNEPTASSLDPTFGFWDNEEDAAYDELSDAQQAQIEHLRASTEQPAQASERKPLEPSIRMTFSMRRAKP